MPGPLFNQKGQSTGRLRDAEGQITNWQTWMQRNEQNILVPRALDKLKERKAWDVWPDLYRPLSGNYYGLMVWYRIIIGRRKDFAGWGDVYRTNKWKQSANQVEIVSWDRLLERARLSWGK